MLLGREFNEMYSSTTFYKLTRESECHNGFQYRTGVNVDTVPFNPLLICRAGLFFTDLHCIPMWIEDHVYIREVIIMEDSVVCVSQNKFKADKFILKEKILLSEFAYWLDESFCKLALYYDAYALQYIRNQTDEMCLKAVTTNPFTLRFVRKQTDIICKCAVQQDGHALLYVHKQTEEICILAIRQNWAVLPYVKKITDEIARMSPI